MDELLKRLNEIRTGQVKVKTEKELDDYLKKRGVDVD